MEFTWDTFLKPLTSGDKNIKVINISGMIKYTINPFSIVNVFVSGNLLKVSLKSGTTITIPFSSLNESQLALPRIKSIKDLLTSTQSPLFVDSGLRNFVESNSNQLLTGESEPTNGSLREGNLWFDGESLRVYAKDENGDLNWIMPKQQSTGFFYSPIEPNPQTSVAGNFWYNTTQGQLYVLVSDDSVNSWVPVGGSPTSTGEFFYQETQPDGTGSSSIPVGSFWFDTTDGILYIYVRDVETGGFYWVTASTSFSTGNLFEFFYQSTLPEGTGSGEIPVGSLWYDTEDGTLFVYVRDGNSNDFVWVTSYGAVGPEGPVGATGSSGNTNQSLTYSVINSESVTYDLSTTTNFFHDQLVADWTCDFINISNEISILEVDIYLSQGDEAFKPNLIKVSGESVEVKWISGSDLDTMIPNSINIVSLKFVTISENQRTILGKVSNYI